MCNVNEMLDYCISNYTIKDTIAILKSVNPDIKYIIINNNLIYSVYTALNTYFNETDKVELYYKNNIKKERIKVTILHNNKKFRYYFSHYFGNHLEYIAKYVMTRYNLLNYKFSILDLVNNETYLIGITNKLVLNIDGKYTITDKGLKKLKNDYPNHDVVCNKIDLFSSNMVISHGDIVFTQKKKDIITLIIIYNYRLYKIIQVLSTYHTNDIKNILNINDTYNLQFGNIILDSSLDKYNIKSWSIIHIIEKVTSITKDKYRK